MYAEKNMILDSVLAFDSARSSADTATICGYMLVFREETTAEKKAGVTVLNSQRSAKDSRKERYAGWRVEELADWLQYSLTCF